MYKISKSILEDFLNDVDQTFPIPLSNKVRLDDYAQKLITKATLCTEMMDNKLVGLVAGYTENIYENMAYIAVVAILKEYHHKGIATHLLKEFFEICKKKKIVSIHVYTDTKNVGAIELYKKVGFEEYIRQDEPRPLDVHLIKYL